MGVPRELLPPDFGAYAPRLGLIAGLLTAVLLGLVWVAARMSSRPVTETYGVVSALGGYETEYGTRFRATVQVDGRSASVFLRPGELCSVGDRIHLRRRGEGAARRYAMGIRGCERL